MLGRGLTFTSDEFAWLLATEDFSPNGLFTPHNGHLIAIPRFVYELFPRLFGIEYLPFRIVSGAAFIGTVCCFHLIARRHLGPRLAALPTTLMLTLGSAALLVLSPLAIPFAFSIFFALAAINNVQAAGRDRDWLTSLLLVLSLLSHSFGGLAAIGISYLLLRRDRRRLWVTILPLGLYAAWWLWALKFDQGLASASNLLSAPLFMAESLVATVAAVTGLAGDTVSGRAGGLGTAVEIAGVGIATIATVGLIARGLGRDRRHVLGSYLATLAVYWFVLGLAEGPGREPTTPRYLFFGSAMLLLAVAASGEGLRPGRKVVIGLTALTIVAAGLNFGRLVSYGNDGRAAATNVRAQLGAIELAAANVDPAFKLREAGPPAARDVGIPAGGYIFFADEYPGLGMSQAEIERAAPAVRSGVDFVLVRSALIGLVRPPEPGQPEPGRSCSIESPPSGETDSASSFPLGEGPISISSEGPEPATILVSRFADEPSVGTASVAAGETVVLAAPEDGIDRAWSVGARVPLTVCR